MKNITVIYHRADFDGIFCREIARKFLGDNAEYIGWDHGDPYIPMPNEGIVYVLDLPPDCLDARQVDSTVYNRIIWIDHHKSSIEKWSTDKGIPPIKGYRIDGVAACRLTWQWFYYGCHDFPLNAANGQLPQKQGFIDRKVSEPLAVQLAGEYDIWDKRNPDAEVFQFGLRSLTLDTHWAELLSLNKRASVAELVELVDAGYKDLLAPDGTNKPAIIYTLLQNGRLLQSYQQSIDANMMWRSVMVKFEGLWFLALNTARCNSLTFASQDIPEARHDGLMGFYWTGSNWSVSLYHAKHRKDLDLSEIAVKYDGGGHRGACGFRAEHLPFIFSPELSKTRELLGAAYQKLSGKTVHASDCSTSAAPAECPLPCDCKV